MALFTHYIALDWSAANAPTSGKDSIWICEGRADGLDAPLNLPTRYAAVEHLRSRLTAIVAAGGSVLLGCDFAFGYPAGTVEGVARSPRWNGVWDYIYSHVTDGADNRSNRFEVAGVMNAALGLSEGPFWGHPHQHSYDNLRPKSPRDLPPSFPQKRLVETRVPSAKSVWQLAYNGAVGSQTILGIAALEGLRRDAVLGEHIAVWPFETKLSGDFSKAVTIAEIYPSSHTVDRSIHATLDAAQIMAVARDFALWDKTGALLDKLSAFGLSDAQRDRVTAAEGWIVGV